MSLLVEFHFFIRLLLSLAMDKHKSLHARATEKRERNARSAAPPAICIDSFTENSRSILLGSLSPYCSLLLHYGRTSLAAANQSTFLSCPSVPSPSSFSMHLLYLRVASRMAE